MFILADNRIPDQAKTTLEKYGEVRYVSSSGITYDAISGHPDIFICAKYNKLAVAPNSPEELQKYLTDKSIQFNIGSSGIGNRYPQTAKYNAIVTDQYLIHNTNITDKNLLSMFDSKEIIHVKQAYTRCNLIPLKNNRFITSDKGIEKTLLNEGLEVLYVNPEGIILPGFENGFIGGACGIYQDSLFFIGNLDHFQEGQKIRKFTFEYNIIELYDGPLFDGGSLIFIV